MLYPLLWMLASSFKPEDEIFADASLWPVDFSLDAYIARLARRCTVSFGTLLLELAASSRCWR